MADGTESSAIELLEPAVDLDTNKTYEESLTCYQEGVGWLMKKYRQKREEYLNRAEELNVYLKEAKEACKKVERIQIEPDSTGHSYESLFMQYLNKFETAVEVQDLYVRKDQIDNFLRLCELVIRKTIPVKTISLFTGKDPNNHPQQYEKLQIVGRSLLKHGIVQLFLNLA